MIALMGIARIHAGEHWPSDVLGRLSPRGIVVGHDGRSSTDGDCAETWHGVERLEHPRKPGVKRVISGPLRRVEAAVSNGRRDKSAAEDLRTTCKCGSRIVVSVSPLAPAGTKARKSQCLNRPMGGTDGALTTPALFHLA